MRLNHDNNQYYFHFLHFWPINFSMQETEIQILYLKNPLQVEIQQLTLRWKIPSRSFWGEKSQRSAFFIFLACHIFHARKALEDNDIQNVFASKNLSTKTLETDTGSSEAKCASISGRIVTSRIFGNFGRTRFYSKKRARNSSERLFVITYLQIENVIENFLPPNVRDGFLGFLEKPLPITLLADSATQVFHVEN